MQRILNVKHLLSLTKNELTKSPVFDKLQLLFRTRSSNASNNSTGLFSNPYLTTPLGFDTLTADTITNAQVLVHQLTTSTDPKLILRKFDELSDLLCRTADLAECIRLLHPDEKYVEYAQKCCTNIGNYVEELNTTTDLYDALKYAIDNGRLDEASARHGASLMHDFEISGIHLSQNDRRKVVELNQLILSLSHTFMNQCSEPVVIEMNKAPDIIRTNARIFPTHKDLLYITHVPYSNNDQTLREHCYRLYYSANHYNNSILEALLDARFQLAQFVGYNTFAHRTLKDSMAGSPEVVMEFLNALNKRILPLAKEEADEMLAIKRLHSTGDSLLGPWDITWVCNKTREKHFDKFSGLEEYFSLNTCMDGINQLLQSLFDLKLELVSIQPGEIWHKTISKYSFSQQNNTLGHLYCDWYARHTKKATDCQFTIQGGRLLNNGSYQMPISTLSLSLSPGQPVLLSQHAVENLFHEMGHAIHSILGRSPYQNTSGTRCSTDFAEVPSNLMELSLQDHRVLTSFAKHYKTHLSLPREAVAFFQLSSNLYPALTAQQQILYSVMDQHFHSRHPLGQSTTDLFADLHNHYSVIDHTPNTAWFLRFTHLYTYAGKYYSYLWSRAVANLIWRKCFRDDPFSRTKGDYYHNKMLAYGGGAHPLTLVRNMLGYEPTVMELVDAFYQEIVDLKSNYVSIN